jgi:hypothetical protein
MPKHKGTELILVCNNLGKVVLELLETKVLTTDFWALQLVAIEITYEGIKSKNRRNYSKIVVINSSVFRSVVSTFVSNNR